MAFDGISRVGFICNQSYEPERYEKLNKMIDTVGMDRSKVDFCAPTYKHTITQEVYRKYVKTPMGAHLPWVKGYTRNSELSLIINFYTNLERIVSDFSDGVFLLFESDVEIRTDNLSYFPDLLHTLKTATGKWDMVNIGGMNGKNGENMWESGYIEDITTQGSTNRLQRKFSTRLCDSHILSYGGAVKLLKMFKDHADYCMPLDHYITFFLENDRGFKYYWSDKYYFYQRTTSGQESSTIQNDPRVASIQTSS
jgi:hypothetical protein